jgi:putative peptidoglycan lipid II flippase
MYDTKTPVIIGSIAVVVNTVLSILFVKVYQLPVWSLALSTSIASGVNLLFLMIYLYRKIHGFNLGQLIIPPLKMFLATCITGVFLYIPLKLLDQLVFDTTRVVDLIILTGIATFIGLSVYIFLAWFFDIAEVASLFKLLKKMRAVPQILSSPSAELVGGDNSSVNQ